MAGLGSLVVDLSADTARFQSDLGRAQHMAENYATSVTKVLGGIGIGVGVAGFVDMIKGTIDAMASLHELSQASGLAVETLSGLELVAKQSGSSLTEVAGVVQKLEKNMFAFAKDGGGKAAAAFEAIGISQEQVTAGLKDIDKFLPEFARKFIETGTAAEKAALAQELMGKAGANALPFLHQLVENGAIFAKVTTEQAAAADNFKDQLDKLAEGSQRLKIALANELLPSLNKVVDAMVRAKQEGGGFLDAVKAAIQTGLTGTDLHKANVEFTQLTDQLLRLQNERSDMVSAGVSKKVLDDMDIGIGKVESRLKVLQSFRTQLEKEEAPQPKGKTKDLTFVDVPAKTKDTKPKGLTFDELLAKNAMARLKAMEDLEKEGEKAAADWQHTLDGLVSDTLIKKTETLQQSADFLRAAFEDGRISAELYAQAMKKLLQTTEELDPRMRAAAAAADSLISQTLIERTRSMQDTADELARRLDQGAISAEQYKQALDVLFDRDKIEKVNDSMKDLGRTFKSALEDAIAGGKDFDDILKAIEKDLLRMGTRRLVSEPFGKWFDKELEGMGGGEGILDKIMSGLGGGPELLNSFASGTSYVPRDMIAKIHQGEQIIPAGQNTGGSTIVMNITTPDAGSFRASRNQIAGEMQAALSAARRNG